MSARALPDSSRRDALGATPVQQQPKPEPGRCSAEAELRSLLGSTRVKQILEEFDELPEFQMRAPKGRKGLLREEHGAECAEIYSPPRVTQVVSEIGLRAAWFLDLTTVDPVDGQPWDFSFEVKRKRAAGAG